MTITLGGPLLLVGAGKMGGALLEGWLEQGLPAESAYVQDPNPPQDVADLLGEHVIATGAPPDLPTEPAVIVLAVKPQAMDEVLPPLKPLVGADTVILSVAAGQKLASLAKYFGAKTAIVRAMPNAPASIGRGITVACSNAHVMPGQAERCITLLSAVGEVEWIDDEILLDAVTAVSGSGPAYVFLLCECLTQAGIDAGLDPDIAERLARATVSGAGDLLRRSDLSASQMRENVTSPGGTTQAALEMLNGEKQLEKLMKQAVEAATKRSRDLSS